MNGRTVVRFELETDLDVADAVAMIIKAVRMVNTSPRFTLIDASRVITFEVAK